MNFKATLAFKKLFALLLFVSSVSLQAQNTGSISGRVIDKEAGDKLPSVRVFILNSNSGAITNDSGDYKIKSIPHGKHKIVFESFGFYSDTIPVQIHAGKNVVLDHALGYEASTTTDVVIEVKKSTGTIASSIEEVKKKDNVVVAVSQEQMGKTQGDRNAADVLRRIPGVTVVDNRFIQIRGLSERYNTVWFNDANAPSLETDKKSFSFDVIPTALIDRILVFKTASPDLPGDFAGGLVKLYTRNTVEKRFFSINYSSSYRQGTTFKNFTSDTETKNDWLGLGAKNRDLPNGFPTIGSNTNNGERDILAKQLKNTWALKSYKAIPDQRFSFIYSDKWNLGKYKLYNITSLNYSYINTKFNIKRGVFDQVGTRTDIRNDEQSTGIARIAALENLTFKINEKHSIDFRNFLTQIGSNQTTVRKSYDANGNQVEQNYQIGYQSRTVYSSQLAGTHSFNKDNTKINWLAGTTLTRRNDPALRRLGYSVTSINDTLHYSAAINLSSSPSPLSGSQLFQKLKENIYTVTANLEQKVKVKDYNFSLNAGTYLENKSRSFNARLLGYYRGMSSGMNFFNNLKNLPVGEIFAPQNIGSDTSFKLSEDINYTYKYTASNYLRAGYLSLNLPYKDKIKFLGGARYEYNKQQINSADIAGNPINANVVTKKLLPSANLSYNFNEKHLVRAAYGKTLNRPEFREWAPFYYYDFDFGALNYGALYLNPNKPLKVANIHNFDLRYEIYPSPSEFIHFGVFYKNFLNPIETVIVPTTNLAYSYTNANSAYLVGAEVDIRKNLASLDSLLGTKAFGNFSFLFNASLMKSRVQLPENALAWNKNRSLQGQSPYVLNAGLYYQHDTLGIQASVVYNVFGPRIVFVGTDGYPDVVELPRNTVDLSLTKRITKSILLVGSVTDLFNQSVIFAQDYNKNNKYERKVDQRLLDFRRGRYFTIGVNIKL